MADGANRLALDDVTRQRLLAALHSEAAQGPRDRLTPPKDTAEVPRDYAPRRRTRRACSTRATASNAEHEKASQEAFLMSVVSNS